MTRQFLRAVFAGGLILALGLFLGGCDQPADGDKDDKPSAAAEAYRDSHWEILNLSLARITLGDETAINEALAAYEALEAGVQTELAAEKTRLDSFKTRVDSSKGSVAALRTWLEGLPENTKHNPYTVAYTGSGSPGAIYNALGAGGKYVSLDLSQSRVTGFGYNTEPGRELVVELALPDSLKETPNADSPRASLFGGFSNLRRVSAAGLVRLGNNAFGNCKSLEEAILDKATEIGDSAFEGCTGLAGISLPAAVKINQRAFYGCAKLAAADLPVAEAIDQYAFRDCVGLTSIDFPAALTIGISVFIGCSNLVTAKLANAETISNSAFYECGKLTSVSLPEVKTLGAVVFYRCSSLATISLPKVENLGVDEVANGRLFHGCVSLETIILGDTPPTNVGTTLFQEITTSTKTVTFKVSDRQAYIDAGTPWSDKMGNSTDWGDYWDSSGNRAKLTVALAAIE